jgi:hypothetical protein
MPFVIDEVIDIDAPRETVWKVITDLPSYGTWNPFVVWCRSTLVVGDPVEMRVVLFRGFARAQRETIFEHIPGERLCYGLDGGSLGAIRSRRCHELQVSAPGRTRYRSHFELSGWLAPVVRGLLGSRLQRGFRSMTAGICHRAEHFAPQA